ncbi:porin family protein [Polaribacter septentrionalilitoris]|uniref:outer membrane beta-barrel protein n=1 Tax=Polaribacter septentrionalilitoris TaxID=2494657 RepID=UPI0013576047|nr:outer membrane beta-barrel protein [Polaribacter septentrionalilitoris]
MKKTPLFTFLLVCTLNLFSQTSFEKGYFINNSGEKIECLIKNLDLLNNPKSFVYKLTKDSSENIATISNVKEFEIYKISKYERHTVKIDRSSENSNELSLTRKVKFTDEQLFLKVLLKGKASLYKYSEPGLLRFFYEIDDIKQLVFKSFLSSDRFTIKKNERYKQQILDNLKCSDIKENRIKKLEYKSSKLVKLFEDYNNCENANFVNYIKENTKKYKAQFNLSLNANVNLLGFSISELGFSASFNNKLALSLGVEAEYVLGFNNNKWAIVINPNYLSYSSMYDDLTDRITKADNSATINYSTIDVPIGIRHYIYLNDKSKFFVNTFLVSNFTMKSEIRSIGTNVNKPLNYDIETDMNYAFGVGYKYNNKFSIELRTYTARDLLNQFASKESSFNSTSVILGYTIF